jgi:hypothetical protein
MHVFVDIQYVLPELSNMTLISGIYVYAKPTDTILIGYYGMNIEVGSNDTSSQLNASLTDGAIAAWESEFSLTIQQSDKVHVFGAAFR